MVFADLTQDEIELESMKLQLELYRQLNQDKVVDKLREITDND